MNLIENEYKKTTNRIGWGLSIFVAVFNVLTAFAVLIPSILFEGKALYVTESILGDIAYLSSFILPGLLIVILLKRAGLFVGMELSFKAKKRDLLLIPAGIGASLAAAYVNSMLVSAFLGDGFSVSFTQGMTRPYELYEIVLMLISTALVPAVCEEFLFRGVILKSLMPYGRNVALIGSAVLFGFMHQNPAQILYTVVAGIFMGYAYIKTRSLLIPMVMHFVNNGYAVFSDVLSVNVGLPVSDIFDLVMMVIFICIGFICFLLYLKGVGESEERKYDGGSYGKVLEFSDTYEEKKIPCRSALKGFFAPGMIVFISLSTLIMVFLIFSLGLFSVVS